MRIWNEAFSALGRFYIPGNTPILCIFAYLHSIEHMKESRPFSFGLLSYVVRIRHNVYSKIYILLGDLCSFVSVMTFWRVVLFAEQ